jgi:hypothetical protein
MARISAAAGSSFVVGLFVVACGGAAVHETAVVDTAIVVSEPASTDAPEPAAVAPAPSPCLFNLATQRYWRPTVTASFENSDIGAVTTTFEQRGEGDELFATFDSRDANGHERGEIEYVCDAEGIRVRRVQSTAGAISFSPAVLVLPATETSGSGSGVAGVRTGEVDTVVNWTHRWQAEVVDAPPAFVAIDATWVRVSSGLTLEGDTLERSWETHTTWAVTERGEFFAARVEQIIREAGQTTTRIENAESLVTTAILPNW